MSHKICISQLTIKCLNIISKVKHIGVKQHFSDTLLARVKNPPMRSNTMFLKNTLELYKIKKKENFTEGKPPNQNYYFFK